MKIIIYQIWFLVYRQMDKQTAYTGALGAEILP